MSEEPTNDTLKSGEITFLDIQKLLLYFSKNTYNAESKHSEVKLALKCCIELMEMDYNVSKIDNTDGKLCWQYPHVIPILESEKDETTIYEYQEHENPENVSIPIPSSNDLHDLFDSAKYARCRQRFPVPVILYKGKNICRSATLASVPEVNLRGRGSSVLTVKALYSLKEFLWPVDDLPTDDEEEESIDPNSDKKGDDKWQPTWPYCDGIREEDVKLLKKLNVDTIFDIMVEKRKVKYGLYVCSSEKVDKERYSDFNLISFPYPGCEFFEKFESNLRAEGLFFDWDNPSCDATLSLEGDYHLLKIKWENFRSWELITITQNYLKFMIRALQDKCSGFLLHCISGWDRTPLFMSLLRLSLWADGVIHRSLNEHQILYLTIAYDWMLFGHHLTNRLVKKEYIFHFCFEMLKYLQGDEFNSRHKITAGTDLDKDNQESNLSPNSSLLETTANLSNNSNGHNGSDVNNSVSADNNATPRSPSRGSPPSNSSKNFSPRPSTSRSHITRIGSSPISIKSRNSSESLSLGSSPSDDWEKVPIPGSQEKESLLITMPFGHKITAGTDLDKDNQESNLSPNSSLVETTANLSNNSNGHNGRDVNNSIVADNNATARTPSCESHPSNSSKNVSPRPSTSRSPITKIGSLPISIKSRNSPENSSLGNSPSDTWEKISATGSKEKESLLLNMPFGRAAKLAKVREIFISSNFRTIDLDTYAPKLGTIESIIETLLELPPYRFRAE